MKNLDISRLEENIKYNFKNKKLIETALTHSSFANESKKNEKSNERLEFLGDSVLGLVVSDYIFLNCPELPEGKLSKLRASLVCEKTLCKFSKDLHVGDFLKLSHGEKNSRGNERPSILADAFEAIIAAIYLDGGLLEAEKFILRYIIPEFENQNLIEFKDYKTMLQEIIQKNKSETISYVLKKECGPDHNKHFEVEVRLNSNVVGKGGGKSKKEAEQQAAREALELMGY
ncbi:MAG: ribonuclease III [Clostridia bacterium]|nr:ribonuclease III [Clostridia bacterium]